MTVPVFSWWPYRILALLIPSIAWGTVELCVFTGAQSTKVDEFTIAMSVFGAGTGFLMGLFRGNLRCAILAVIAGAIVGLFLPALFEIKLVPLIVAIVLLISLVWGAFRRDQSLLPLIVAITISFLILYNVAIPVFESFLNGPPSREKGDEIEVILRGLFELAIQRTMSIWYGIPILCLTMSLFVTREWEVRSFMRTASNLCNASVVGLSFSYPLVYLALVLRLDLPNLEVVGLFVFCSSLANYIFAHQIFGVLRPSAITHSR